MATTPNSESSRDDFTPAYVVGVTGHMNLPTGEVTRLKQEVRAFFLAMMDGEKKPSLLPAGWVALKDTPILVLSNLAPGADTLVAEVALDLRDGIPEDGNQDPSKRLPKRRIQVKAPLAYPPEIYPLCTSFKVSSFHPGAKGDKAAELEHDARETFARLKDKIGTENLWAVELAEDFKNPPSEAVLRLEAWAADPVSKQTRHRRYAAAGEHVATYCNLLIAIWERGSKAGPGGSCDTAVGKLEGFVPAHLPNATGFTWTPTGAVAHFPCTRMVSAKDRAKAAAAAAEARAGAAATDTAGDKPTDEDKDTQAVHFLYPGDLAHLVGPSTKEDGENGKDKAAKVESPEEAADRRRSFAKKLVEGAKCLVDFNTLSHPAHESWDLSSAAVKDQLSKEDKEAKSGLGTALDHFEPVAKAELEKLGRVRRRAAAGTGRLTGTTDRATYHLFWMAIVSALSLHMWVHPFTQAYAFPTVMLVLSVLVVLGAYKYHGHYEHQHVEPRDHDWRVLAEAFRVQLYLAAAGINQSVAASYMQRHRHELHWMRMALSSLAAPYGRWKDWFPKKEAEQLEVLGQIHKSWLESQRKYFINSSTRCDHKQHSWAELAFTLAMSGVMLALLAEASRLHFFTLPQAAAPMWAAAVVLLILLTWWATKLGAAEEACLDGKKLKGPLVNDLKTTRWERDPAGGKREVERTTGVPLWRHLQFLFHLLFPTEAAAEKDKSGRTAKLRGACVRHAIRGALALVIALGCLLACEWAHHAMHPHAPGHGDDDRQATSASTSHSTQPGALETAHAATPVPTPVPAMTSALPAEAAVVTAAGAAPADAPAPAQAQEGTPAAPDAAAASVPAPGAAQAADAPASLDTAYAPAAGGKDSAHAPAEAAHQAAAKAPHEEHHEAAGHTTTTTTQPAAPAVLNHFSAIWVGTLLLFAALSVAWRENRLFSEHSRQYHTMATLYNAASDRMDRHLKEMKKALEKKASDGTTPDPDHEAFNHHLAELRRLLIAVGEEALDENAEWLILHRSRPLEPLIH